MSVKYWQAKAALYEFDYDTGTHSPVVGEIINVDVAAGETAIVVAWTVASGAWGTNDAAGKMWVYNASATFITNLENNDNIDDASDNQICITTGGVTLVTSDWQIPANWGSGADPTIPVADDEVIFDDRSVLDVTDGIAIGETGGVSLDLLHVKSGYTGDIGTAVEKLHINPDKVIYEGTGTMYLECSAADVTTDSDIDEVIMDTADGTLILSSSINSNTWASVFTEVRVLQCTLLRIDKGCDVATLRIKPKYGRSANADVVIEIDCYHQKGTDTFMDIEMTEGTCLCLSQLNSIDLTKGTFTYGGDVQLVFFTSGGTNAPDVGDTLTGKTSGATAIIDNITVTSGVWADGDAAGFFRLSSRTWNFTPSEAAVFEGAVDDCTLAADSAFEADLNIEEVRISGGTLIWYPEDSGGDAYIGELQLFGGILDASAIPCADKTNRAKALGNGAGDVFLYEGSMLNIANGRGNITIGTQLFHYGGTLTVDRGTQIGLTYDAP